MKCGKNLYIGDVVYSAPMERFRWGGDMGMIVLCELAFNTSRHHLEGGAR